MHSSIHKDGTDKAAPPLDVTDKAAPPLDVTDKAAPPLDVTDKAAPPLDVTDKAAPPLLDVLCGQSIVNVMNVRLIARQKVLSAKAPKNNHMSVVVFGGLPERNFCLALSWKKPFPTVFVGWYPGYQPTKTVGNGFFQILLVQQLREPELRLVTTAWGFSGLLSKLGRREAILYLRTNTLLNSTK